MFFTFHTFAKGGDSLLGTKFTHVLTVELVLHRGGNLLQGTIGEDG